MVDLQKLHEKYASRGLVVLGFNNADKPAIAREHLNKHKIAYPSVLDSSEAGISTGIGKYKVGAVPTTYVIDRDGKIAAAWIGGQEDNAKWVELLGKLGIGSDADSYKPPTR